MPSSLGAIEAPSMNSANSPVSARPSQTEGGVAAAVSDARVAIGYLPSPQRRASGHRLLGDGRALGDRARVHERVLPDVAVGIVAAAPVHDPEVLVRGRLRPAAGLHRLAY